MVAVTATQHAGSAATTERSSAHLVDLCAHSGGGGPRGYCAPALPTLRMHAPRALAAWESAPPEYVLNCDGSAATQVEREGGAGQGKTTQGVRWGSSGSASPSWAWACEGPSRSACRRHTCHCSCKQWLVWCRCSSHCSCKQWLAWCRCSCHCSCKQWLAWYRCGCHCSCK